jgi:hypothetical protein
MAARPEPTMERTRAEGSGLPWPVRAVYVFLLITIGTALSLLILAPGSEDWFPWTIVPDASARMIAVVYLNAFLLVLFAWRTRDWAHTRAVFVPVTVFSVAATIVTLTNLDPFRASPADHLPFWLGAYGLLFVATPVVLVLEERAHGGRLPRQVPLSGLARVVGGLSGVALGATAIALFIDPSGVSDVWPWTLAPLVGRVFAVWLLALATAYAWVLWDGDWLRGRAIFLTAPISGIALLLVPVIHNGDVGGGSLVLYLALAGLLVANLLPVLRNPESGRGLPPVGPV